MNFKNLWYNQLEHRNSTLDGGIFMPPGLQLNNNTTDRKSGCLVVGKGLQRHNYRLSELRRSAGWPVPLQAFALSIGKSKLGASQ